MTSRVQPRDDPLETAGVDPRDERGLIGKVVLVWLLVVAALALAALDGGSIVLTRIRVSDLANDASAAAAEVLELTGSEEAAKLAALETIETSETEARLHRIGFERDEVTVVLRARADTIVVDLVPFLEGFGKIAVTDSATPHA